MTSTNVLTKSRTRYHLTITPLHKGVFIFLYSNYILYIQNHVTYIKNRKDRTFIMLLKLGIFFIAIGITKFIYAMYLKHKQK